MESILDAPADDTPRHPQVLIAKKRPNHDLDESETVPRKRARHVIPSDNDTQDSRLSSIAVEMPPMVTPASKGKKRKSTVKEVEKEIEHESTPSCSQRSQRSISAATSELYQGDTPCVATSNSAITDKR